MANSVDPDQTALIGVVCSGSTLFTSVLNLSVMQGDDFSRRYFQIHFFLGALRVKFKLETAGTYRIGDRRSSDEAAYSCSLTSTRAFVARRHKVLYSLPFRLL